MEGFIGCAVTVNVFCCVCSLLRCTFSAKTESNAPSMHSFADSLSTVLRDGTGSNGDILRKGHSRKKGKLSSSRRVGLGREFGFPLPAQSFPDPDSMLHAEIALHRTGSMGKRESFPSVPPVGAFAAKGKPMPIFCWSSLSGHRRDHDRVCFCRSRGCSSSLAPLSADSRLVIPFRGFWVFWTRFTKLERR